MFSKLTSTLRRSQPVGDATGFSGKEEGRDDDNAAAGKRSNAIELPPLSQTTRDKLQQLGVPLSDCDACSHPCSSDEERFAQAEGMPAPDASFLRSWAKQDVDLSSELLGSTSGFARQVLVSTNGKRDWERDVLESKHTVAGWLARRRDEDAPANVKGDQEDGEEVQGIWRSGSPQADAASPAASRRWKATRPTNLGIVNSSHYSTSDEDGVQSLMLFPDWLLVQNVPAPADADREQMQEMYNKWISPSAGPAESAFSSTSSTRFKRSVLPYSAVILLCSHKKRDVRCHLAATVLMDQFRHLAEHSGWNVDDRGDDAHTHDLPQGFELPGSQSNEQPNGDMRAAEGARRRWGHIDENAGPEAAQEQIRAWRRAAMAPFTSSADDPQDPSGKRASATPTLGIFYISHIGGHKFSGNVILYLPQGAGVWYGRVDPAKPEHAQLVWNETVLRGNVVPEFLRGGMNLTRQGEGPPGKCRRINEW